MIATLVALATLQVGVKASVLELPDPAADIVTIHAYLWRDRNFEREDAAWEVISNSIGEISVTYGVKEVNFFGSTAGIAPRVVRAPGFVRVEIIASPAKWQNAVALATSLISQPSWSANFWEDELTVAKGRVLDPWQNSLWPKPVFPKEMIEQDFSSTHARILDKSGISIVVSGPLERGAARAVVDQYSKMWEVQPYARLPRYAEEAAWPTQQMLGVSSFELAGKPIRIGEGDSAAKFLALMALGAGKDCSTWRMLREEAGLSYRTEGILWPTQKGFVPRLIMLRRSEESELKYSGTMIDLLRKDVDRYDQITLDRAKAMATQVLTKPSPFACVYVDGSSTLYGQPGDELRWRGMLYSMGLPSISISKWVETLNQVTEAQLRTAAKDLMDGCEFRLIRGQPSMARLASN